MKVSTLSALLFSGSLLLFSCGEHSHDNEENGDDKKAPETAEQMKQAEEKINEINSSMETLGKKSEDLDAAINDLDF